MPGLTRREAFNSPAGAPGSAARLALNCGASCRKENGSTCGRISKPLFGNVVGHEQCVDPLDRLVVIGIDDPGRRRDAAELLGRKMRLRLPHLHHLARKASYSVRRRRRLSYSVFARAMIGVEHRALRDVRDAGRIGIGGEGKQSGQPLGMMDGDVEPDDRAVAPADDRGLARSSENPSGPSTSEAIRS